MAKYCKSQGQVLSDMHVCPTCGPASEPNWRSIVDQLRKEIQTLKNRIKELE